MVRGSGSITTITPVAIIVLAAGKGTRMGTPGIAKVLNRVGGRPMIAHVLDTAFSINSHKLIVVIGFDSDSVRSSVGYSHPTADFVHQHEQLGTGHAVLQCEDALADFNGDILILSGDVPLLREITIRSLLTTHQQTGAEATVLTTRVSDPTGYGRIERDEKGNFIGIVEHKDATDGQLGITEINTGIYTVKSSVLFPALKELRADNAQGEYYLTDIIKLLSEQGLSVYSVETANPLEAAGVNTPAELEAADYSYNTLLSGTT